MNLKIAVLCCLAVAAFALPEEYGLYDAVPAQYAFDYAVIDPYSGNNFGHNEQREGDNTQGSYFVHLPDGRIQRVKYYVTKDSGFVAEVTYEGTAVYPESKPALTPVYEAQPSYP